VYYMYSCTCVSSVLDEIFLNEKKNGDWMWISIIRRTYEGGEASCGLRVLTLEIIGCSLCGFPADVADDLPSVSLPDCVI